MEVENYGVNLVRQKERRYLIRLLNRNLVLPCIGEALLENWRLIRRG